MKELSIMLLFTFLLVKETRASSVLWDYQSKGPDYWKIPYSGCGGQYQSPINIVTSSTVYDNTLKDLDLTGYNATLTWTLINTGACTGAGLCGSNISGFKRDTKPAPIVNGANLAYNNTLIQYHFHWGYNDYSGNEHTIDGAQNPLELHLVHSNSNNSNLLMIAFIFQLSTQNNTNLDNFISTISLLSTASSRKNLTFAIGSILPTAAEISAAGYFYYYGSITLPPCSEGVNWVVYRTKINISSAQLSVFRQNQFLINYRDVQPLNSRTVYSNKNLTVTTTVSSVKNKLGLLGMFGIFFWKIF